MENQFANICQKCFNDFRNNANGGSVKNSEAENETENTLNYIENYVTNYTSNFDSSGDNYIALISNELSNKITPMDLNLTIRKTDCSLQLETGSAG